MDKEVLITINSSQTIDGSEAQGAELITQGTYSFQEGQIRFSYMESELTGLEGTKTDFLIGREEIVMSRQGAVNARMVFRRGKKHLFLYETPYGALTLGLDTQRIQSDLDEHGGGLEVEYDLDFERTHISRNKFKINVREKAEKELAQ
ncbi:MAG: DUF1934 domain-containing protein [Oscillospiraceae bacterium]